jgi:hypothetical protein
MRKAMDFNVVLIVPSGIGSLLRLQQPRGEQDERCGFVSLNIQYAIASSFVSIRCA